MKVIIKIEEQDDMQKVKKFLNSFEITKVQSFFAYLDKTAVFVKKIEQRFA
jgi:hypothetical protein